MGTQDVCLCYNGTNGEGLFGYMDSSLADQTDNHHSTSDYVFLLANGAISWSSQKQKTVAQNTTHAEYMAMTDTSNQGVWYRSFFMELGYTVDEPILLHGDNKCTIDLAENPVTGHRSKHVTFMGYVYLYRLIYWLISGLLYKSASGLAWGPHYAYYIAFYLITLPNAFRKMYGAQNTSDERERFCKCSRLMYGTGDING